MSTLQERIEKLSPEKKTLLSKKIRAMQEREESSDGGRQRLTRKLSLPTVERSDKNLLSFTQQRIWFLDQMDGGSVAYNVYATLEIIGPLQCQILEKSLSEIVRRHEILRTTYPVVDGEPVQRVRPAEPISIPIIELSSLNEPEQTAELKRRTQADARQSLDLAIGPLFRVVLYKIADDQHLLGVTMHHIMTDGWSTSVLVRELTLLYPAFAQHEPSPLPPLPVQYVDYAHWQHDVLQGESLEKLNTYWQDTLAGVPTLLELPTDHPRPRVQSFEGQTFHFELGKELAHNVNKWCARAAVTPNMFLLTAYAILLHRYSGQDDVVVGSLVANRTRAELENLIGFFANTVALRIDLTDTPTFQGLLEQVQAVVKDAFAYQDLPFGKVIEAVNPTRVLSHNPVVQVMFVYQNAPRATLQLPDLTLKPNMAQDIGQARFDLSLQMWEENGSLNGICIFNTDLFEPDTIAQFIACYEILLKWVVDSPAVEMESTQIAKIPLLSPTTRHQILHEWNTTEADYPRDLCLHHFFEQQATRKPNSIALSLANQEMTYRDLNVRANQLAHFLRKKGVSSDVLVGISMERSFDMIVAVLAVIKAGGAYVPLDPTYPEDRLAFMIEDTQAPLVLTHDRILSRLPESAAEFISMESVISLLDDFETDNPETKTTASGLAYIIFTSGSTGKPKGVMIDHRSAVNTILDINDRFRITEIDRVLGLSELGFDLSVYDVFGTLATGATLVILPPQDRREPPRWAALVVKQNVTVWNSVPALMELYIDYIEQTPTLRPNSLRVVMMSGDWIPVSLPNRIKIQVDGVSVYSLGGATEASIWSIFYPIEEVEPEWTSIPYGYPLANQRFHILNEALEPCPVGVPGELYIGGEGVALGYWNRPDLTQEKFIPDPFSAKSDARLYRTGDRGRYWANGAIEFMGRIDFQVKVRGYRIELGEIESSLNQYAGIEESLSIVHMTDAGDQQLVAYFTTNTNDDIDASDLRSQLGKTLPDYMIPAAFVQMDVWPLTANGKVDRDGLPSPSDSRPDISHKYVAARTALETLLTDMWEETTGLAEIGVFDNFFELGGDSIKAGIMINRLRDMLGEYVYVIALFDSPTIAALATYLEENYAEALARILPSEAGLFLDGSIDDQLTHEKVTAADIDVLQNLVYPMPALPQPVSTKNPPAIFILCPPRSGSTLLRVMLAGHPQLFAPPSLELLSFNTLEERAKRFTGGNRFWLEGTIRALMQIHGCNGEDAEQIMLELEAKNLSSHQFYRLVQEQLHNKQLVDKTPSYVFDLDILQRAETYFEDARYIHLVRHPIGMIQSFEEARTDQVYQIFFKEQPPMAQRQFAESIWTMSHQNTLAFLDGVAAERQVRVQFEQLVQEPRTTMEEICKSLALPFDEAMLMPHQEKEQRMTDGVHDATSMVGDVKFHQHQKIVPDVADRWMHRYTTNFLGEPTNQLAQLFGYDDCVTSSSDQPRTHSVTARLPIVPIKPGSTTPPLFMIHPITGDVTTYVNLARHLHPAIPLYGLQAPGLHGQKEPLNRIEDMGIHYLDAILNVQPEGPYYLGGWSLGGLIAFDIAQRLRQQGKEVKLLTLIDSYTPSMLDTIYTEDVSGQDETGLWRLLMDEFAKVVGIDRTEQLARLEQMDSDEQFQHLTELAQELGVLPHGFQMQQAVQLLPMIKAHRLAVQRYKPQPYTGDILLFTAANSQLGKAEEFNGWAELIDGKIKSLQLTGDHYSIMQEPSIQHLAERLNKALDESESCSKNANRVSI